MTVQLHLDAVTLEDRARPDDSPFRHMIYSTPDETSHGGLIHVTYWASAGGIRRVPPVSIADTNQQEYDMVADARFSTLQVGGNATLEKMCNWMWQLVRLPVLDGGVLCRDRCSSV